MHTVVPKMRAIQFFATPLTTGYTGTAEQYVTRHSFKWKKMKKIINLKRFSTRYTIIQARVEPVANYKCDLE